jgi:hypothetical protein
MRAKFWGCRHSESNNSRLLEKTNIAGHYHSEYAPLYDPAPLAVDEAHHRLSAVLSVTAPSRRLADVRTGEGASVFGSCGFTAFANRPRRSCSCRAPIWPPCSGSCAPGPRITTEVYGHLAPVTSKRRLIASVRADARGPGRDGHPDQRRSHRQRSFRHRPARSGLGGWRLGAAAARPTSRRRGSVFYPTPGSPMYPRRDAWESPKDVADLSCRGERI